MPLTDLVKTSNWRLLMVAFLFLTITVARQMVATTIPTRTTKNAASNPTTSPIEFSLGEGVMSSATVVTSSSATVVTGKSGSDGGGRHVNEHGHFNCLYNTSYLNPCINTAGT